MNLYVWRTWIGFGLLGFAANVAFVATGALRNPCEGSERYSLAVVAPVILLFAGVAFHVARANGRSLATRARTVLALSVGAMIGAPFGEGASDARFEWTCRRAMREVASAVVRIEDEAHRNHVDPVAADVERVVNAIPELPFHATASVQGEHVDIELSSFLANVDTGRIGFNAQWFSKSREWVVYPP